MKLYRIMTRFWLAGMLLALVNLAPAAPLFLEDFKDGGANFADGVLAYNWDDQDTTGVTITETRQGDVVDVLSTNCHLWQAYYLEYPKTGTISWDTTQNKYMQAYIPWQNVSDIVGIQYQVDGGDWVNDAFNNRFDNAEQWYHTRPTLFDVNTKLKLTAGVHQLRFRFTVWNSQYGVGEQLNTVGMTIDWIKAGMSPSADITIGRWKKPGEPEATSVVCGFVGPADGTVVSGPPTLQWSAPADYTNLKYIVTYSQDKWFRGPTTVTVHNVTGTSYTPPTALAAGQWFWTVIPVNSDDICGQDMFKSLKAGGYWNASEDYSFYSFTSTGPNAVKHWDIFE